MATNNRHFINTTAANKFYRNIFCLTHTAKMAGNISISTSPALNERCAQRAACGNSKCICVECFAFSMLNTYSALGKKLARNTEILTSDIIPWDCIPEINPERHPAARIEAFGDLNNTIQAINYINLIKKNPGVMFAWWTKNPDRIAAAIEAGYDIPENVNIIYSSPIIDHCSDGAAMMHKYPFINKVFTVYRSDTSCKAHTGAAANCGARHCMTCKLCYSKNDTIYVNEILR